MRVLQLLSPAKLNLMLHITGRREDGYHLLQTLFQLLDYGDPMQFSATRSAGITVSPTLTNVAPEDNLIYRAARLLQTATGCTLGAEIQIDKRLPMGGGLGGGSSNAATTLIALNELWQTGLSLNALAELGLSLGADVPVFVHGRCAWAEGVGEQLQPIETPTHHYLVVKPACHVSTAEIFSHKQLTRNSPPITIAAFFEQGGHNDCQDVVRALYPEVDKTLIWLTKEAPQQNVLMTGTGACVFAEFADKPAAEAILNRLPAELNGFIARGINLSPVHQALDL